MVLMEGNAAKSGWLNFDAGAELKGEAFLKALHQRMKFAGKRHFA